MGHFHHFNLGINLTPPPNQSTAIGVQISPQSLQFLGLNFLVEVSTASAFLRSANPPSRSSVAIMAHLDTGASNTSIEDKLANHLGLITTGTGQVATANGFRQVNHYSIDINFINTPLNGIQNIQVSSCQLPHFDLQAALQNPNIPQNFGMLIGRDIMSRWNVTWHGPLSMVFISD